MRVQRQSDTFQNREGNSHRTAKEKVIKALQNNGFETYAESGPYLNGMIIDSTGKKLDHIGKNGTYFHPFDILAFKKSVKSGLYIAYAIEIDGEIHEKKRVKVRDELHKEIMNLHFPNYVVKHIDKYDVLPKHITDDNIIAQLGLK